MNTLEIASPASFALAVLRSLASESVLRNGLVRDPAAEAAANARELRSDQPLSADERRLHCLRAIQFDAWTNEFLGRTPQGTVIELGAGFSTRLQRVDNGRVRWICVDDEETIAVRRRVLPKHERLLQFVSSPTCERWIDSAPPAAECLLLCERPLAQLPYAAVKAYLKRLGWKRRRALIAWETQAASDPTDGDWTCDDPHQREHFGEILSLLQTVAPEEIKPVSGGWWCGLTSYFGAARTADLGRRFHLSRLA